MSDTPKISRRLPAEWEEQSFVQLTFPHAASDWKDDLELVIPVFVEIIAQITRFEKVLLVCQDKAETEKHFKNLDKTQLDRITFAEIDSNDTWARDHGAITVFENDEEKTEKIHLDFTFNGWGNKFEAGKDNKITQNLKNKNYLKGKVEVVDFVLEGGSIESDGKGTILTTSECLLSKERNPSFSREEIEEKVKGYFGAKHILWLENGALEGDDTDAHIDTLARLCPNNTICYVAPPADKTDSHYESLKKMEEELQNLKTIDNNSYKLIPLPFAPAAYHEEDNRRLPATYANFLIINNAVLVPTYQNEKLDDLALSQIQKVFPNREIIGINCLPIIRQHGSLHCLTMQFPK
ncbi:agmatine deiminase family protein [Bernardetia sp.]|uniref:agmatine deiminase family protein n=1 Tax=Bernardetia sp. TaxID=1937974 RepID=UPI0025BD3A20|nr:agmatine deiminase family protein [Bernardetia sp.]